MSIAREGLPHGQYTPWLEENFEFTARYAREFVSFYTQYRNSSSVFEGMSWTKVRQLLSLPSEIDRQEFVETPHTIPSTGGEKTIDEMTVRELHEVKAELKKVQEDRDAERKQREQAVAQAETAQRSEDILRRG